MSDSTKQIASTRLRSKTYSMAVYIVVGFIFLEILLLGAMFWFRQAVVRIERQGPPLSEQVGEENKKVLQSLINENKEITNLVANLPRPEIDARLSIEQAKKASEEIFKLNEEARRFMQQGDFFLAEAALNEALDRDPKHLLALTNYAMLEEARGNNRESLNYWKKVINYGDRKGKTFQLAKKRASLLEEALRLREEAKKREENLLQKNREEAQGLISLDKVETKMDQETDAGITMQKDFILKLNKSQVKIDPGKLKIQLFFYETLGNNKLAPAMIEAYFLNNPPNWSSNNRELLRAKYVEAMGERRKFFGYLMRIYYNNELQEETASPKTLLRLFPRSE